MADIAKIQSINSRLSQLNRQLASYRSSLDKISTLDQNLSKFSKNLDETYERLRSAYTVDGQTIDSGQLNNTKLTIGYIKKDLYNGLIKNLKTKILEIERELKQLKAERHMLER